MSIEEKLKEFTKPKRHLLELYEEEKELGSGTFGYI